MTTADAVAHFAAKLAFEIDPSDVHAAFEAGSPGFVLIDTRSLAAWEQGHVRGAVHVPRAELAAHIPGRYAPDTQFVVYCWGPGCNGATRSALALATLGYEVKEMIGGFEYWAREGLPVDAVQSGEPRDATRIPDPLAAPVPVGGGLIACDC